MNIHSIYLLSQTFLKKASDIYYHGGKEITDFSSLRFDRDRSSKDLNANGPGFYLTKDINEAKSYGDIIYKTYISDYSNIIKNEKPKLNIIKKFFKLASKEQKELFLSNWGENISEDYALEHYLSYDLLIESLITLYHDLLQYNSNEFIRIMKKLGYDGYLDTNRNHLIIYDMSKIQLEPISL